MVVAHCHCLDCQRISGSGHTTGAMFPEGSLRIRGEMGTFDIEADSGSTVTRSFCRKCGSHLFGQNTSMPGFKAVAVGTLDEPDTVTPQVVVFARSRRGWDEMDTELPTYDGQPNWRPHDGV